MSKLIDQEIIDSLREIGDNDFVVELIDIFLSQSAELIADIKKAAAGANTSDLLKSAHKLKGSCLNLGAVELSAICQQLEAKSREADFQGIEQVMQTMEPVYVET